MKRLLLAGVFTVFGISAALAQAPGWIPTGEWQCGPNVRIVVSIDGYGAMNFFVAGAWFDNNYTVRRGQLYYNSIPAPPSAMCGHRNRHANERTCPMIRRRTD